MLNKTALQVGSVVLTCCITDAYVCEHLRYAPQPASQHIGLWLTGGSSISTVTGAGYNTSTFAEILPIPMHEPGITESSS